MNITQFTNRYGLSQNQAAAAAGFGLFLFSFAWLLFGILPIVEEPNAHKYGRYLADSDRYLLESMDFDITEISSYSASDDQGISSLVQGGTNVILYLQARFSDSLFPINQRIAIFLTNVLLLALTFTLLFASLKRLNLTLSNFGAVLIVSNPGAWISTLSLTKEIWGLLFVALLVHFGVRHKWGLFVAVSLVSFWIRGYYMAIGISVLLTKRVRWQYIVVVLAIILGLVESVGGGDFTQFRIERSRDLGQRSGHLMYALGMIQSYPLGHLIAGPLILAVNVISPAFNPSQYKTGISALYVLGMSASSIYTICLGGNYIWINKTRLTHLQTPKHWYNHKLLFMVLIMFVTITTMYPISQHRFLIPVTPLVAIIALSGPARKVESPR